MTRTGKIACLPADIRAEVNFALRNGVRLVKLMRWLNTLPEVQFVLAQNFGGHPINQTNLTQWKKGGYADWLLRQECLELAAALPTVQPAQNKSK